MLVLDNRQKELAGRIDCSRCDSNRLCDRVISECPKVNFFTLQIDDENILKPEPETVEKESREFDVIFQETTKKDFDIHLYNNITRCRYQNRVLSFFSSEREVQRPIFFFAHQGRCFKALQDKSVSDDSLDRNIINFLFPDKKSFAYKGWFCRFDAKEMLFHLYTPNEMEQPAGTRYSEMEASSPSQAIEFINSY